MRALQKLTKRVALDLTRRIRGAASMQRPNSPDGLSLADAFPDSIAM